MSIVGSQDDRNVPLSSTERSRLLRERRRLGLTLANVEVFQSEIDWLVAAGLLPASERIDPSEIGYAVERLLQRSAQRNAVAGIDIRNNSQGI